MRRLVLLLTALLGVGAVAAILVFAEGESRATEPARWSAHASAQSVRLDDGPWARFLERYAREHPDGVNRVDYGGVARADRAALKRWLAAMQRVEVARLTKAQQMAYWINLYNAATIDVVLDAYPVSSILPVRGGLLNRGPWREKLLKVGGEKLSLDDVEHRILRPLWKDPRIHYAVNCASIGCPNIRLEPFRAERLQAQLDEAAVAFVNHPRAFRVRGGKVEASNIYEWYADDFGGAAGVLRHARRYARGAQAAALRRASGIHAYHYDWRLNDILTK